MRGALLNLLRVLSLALCVAALAMWGRSHRHEDRFTFRAPDGRYMLQSHRGRLVLFGPPTRGAAGLEARAWELTAALRNEHLYWVRIQPAARGALCDYPPSPAATTFPRFRNGTAAAELAQLNGPELARPLLKALDDPSKFAAAHVLLAPSLTPPWPLPVVDGDGYSGKYLYDGMSFELDDDRAGRVSGGLAVSPPTQIIYARPGAWVAHPVQLPALRARWHARLDREFGSASHLWVAAGALVLPVLWVRAQFRRARLRAVGCCAECGYDLRGMPGRCPECGCKGDHFPTGS